MKYIQSHKKLLLKIMLYTIGITMMPLGVYMIIQIIEFIIILVL